MRRLPLFMLTAIALSTFAGGCGYFADGNPLASRDEYNYPSTTNMPQTVILRDMRTDQVLYSWEIPVDQKLFVRFLADETAQKAGNPNPDTCEWLYYPISLWNPPMEHRTRFNVPANNARRLELVLRPAPELPPSMKPADVPMPPSDLPPVK